MSKNGVQEGIIIHSYDTQDNFLYVVFVVFILWLKKIMIQFS